VSAVKRPLGFVFLAGVLAIQLAGSLTAPVMLPPLRPGLSPLDALFAISAVALSAVSIEALWRVRPWATRAFGAMSAAGLGWLLATLIGHTRIDSFFVIVLFFAFAPLGIATAYIDDRIRARFPRPPRVPAPRPSAPGRVP
jgi:hypothetical protein